MTTKSTFKTTAASMNIYCCGGAGVNMGFLLKNAEFFKTEGYANVNIVFIDTSLSNMRGREVSAEELYIIDGRDGSGGLRTENNKSIAQTMDDLLLRHPAARYNIVISSVSGGSGSVIAPNLVGKLLAEDALVVGIVIGDTSTGVFANNTVKTIQSFSGVVSKFPQKTLPLTVVLNHHSRTRQSVNNAVCQHVAYYAALFSETLMALDYSDIYNWVHQERVTGIKAPLTMVSANYSNPDGTLVDDKTVTPVDFESVATMLSLLIEPGDVALTSHEYPLPYATAGHALHDYSDLFMLGNLNLLTHTNVADFFNQVGAENAGAQKAFKARKHTQAIVPTDSLDSDGMAY